MNTAKEIGTSREAIFERRKGYAEALIRHSVCNSNERQRADELAKAALPLPRKAVLRVEEFEGVEYRVDHGRLQHFAHYGKWVTTEALADRVYRATSPAYFLRLIAGLYERPTELVDDPE